MTINQFFEMYNKKGMPDDLFLKLHNRFVKENTQLFLVGSGVEKEIQKRKGCGSISLLFQSPEFGDDKNINALIVINQKNEKIVDVLINMDWFFISEDNLPVVQKLIRTIRQNVQWLIKEM